MKSLIILRGLVKSEKIKWVKKENLQNYFLDINTFKKLYSTPELLYPGREVLNKSFYELVYNRFLEALCTKMGRGNLIVIDPESDFGNDILESLSFIYGYTIFYVYYETPKDYIENQKNYGIYYYNSKKKPELESEINKFNNIDLSEKIIIKSYNDVLNYWKKRNKVFNKFTKILHISDLHSNYNLIPDLGNYELVVFHGDYIDGPIIGGSRKITDLIKKDSNQKHIYLEGNHELRLRKYLGYLMFKDCKKQFITDYLYNSLPKDFLDTTSKEYNNLSPEKAKLYLSTLNKKLTPYIQIDMEGNRYICSHSGLRYKEQLDPKFIGSLIYGNRDVNRYDKEFSNTNKTNNLYSIHAHCKYNDEWNTNKFDKVINLDPPNENEIVVAENNNNTWKICLLKNQLS